jgi:hypothetical protein
MAAVAFYKGKLTSGQITAHYGAIARTATVWTPAVTSAVLSLEGLTGALGITSPDSSVTIGVSSSNITLEATGGGGGGSIPYDATILAEATLTNYYKMNDAVGSTSLHDSKGSTNLTVNGTPGLDSQTLTHDLEGSLAFFADASAYITLPSGLIVTSGAYTVEFIARVWPFTNRFPILFSASSSAGSNGLEIYFDAQNTWALNGNGGSIVINFQGGGQGVGATSPIHITVTWDGTTTRFYMNGAQVGSSSTHITPTSGRIGCRSDGSLPFYGNIAKLAIYSSALSAASLRAHIANI